MSKDEIRVHYSGFIMFAAQMLGVATGVIFTLLLTRNMINLEYGIWSNIFERKFSNPVSVTICLLSR